MVNILKNDIRPIPKGYSDELKFLISQLLIKDVNKRPSLSEILKYQFIIDKMNSLGLTQWYSNWDECQTTISPVSADYSQKLHLKYDTIAGCSVKIEEDVDEDKYDKYEDKDQNGHLLSNGNGGIKKRMLTDQQTPIAKSKHFKKIDVKKKYSPSYGIQEMGSIMKELKIEEKKTSKAGGSPYLWDKAKQNRIISKEIQMSPNLNYANHNSEPSVKINSESKQKSFCPVEKILIEKRAKCTRNKSYGDKIVFINHTKPPPMTCKKLYTPMTLEHKYANANPNPAQFNSNCSNCRGNANFISTPQSNSYCSDIGTFGSNNASTGASASKYRTGNKELSSRRRSPTEICISMDIDSPANNSVFHISKIEKK